MDGTEKWIELKKDKWVELKGEKKCQKCGGKLYLKEVYERWYLESCPNCNGREL